MALFGKSQPESAPSTTGGEGDKGTPVRQKRQDLLRIHSKKMTVILLALGVAAFAASFSTGVHGGLPSAALDWVFGLQLLRAAIAFAIVAALIILIVRGWGGLWPQRITTTSLEFPEAEEDVVEGTVEAGQIMRELLTELQARRSGPSG